MDIGRNELCPCGSGKKFKNCCLDNPKSVSGRKYLYKIVVARSDIKEAFDACILFLEIVKDMKNSLYFPLLRAIIISYAKPFTSNRPLGPLSAKWSNYEEKNHQKLHKIIIDLRNKTIAHSDKNIRKVFICPNGTPVISGQKFSGLGVEVSNTLLHIHTIEKIQEMCAELGGKLNKEVNRQINALYHNQQYPPERFELNW